MNVCPRIPLPRPARRAASHRQSRPVRMGSRGCSFLSITAARFPYTRWARVRGVAWLVRTVPLPAHGVLVPDDDVTVIG